MCPNRVEELESRVQELEASVEGLTDELVECKVRIRELENAVDEDIGFGSEDAESGDDIETAEPSVGAETIDGETGEPFGAAESPAETEAEATKTEGADSENNTDDSDSDIIIA
ncbi:bZIP transcription factor [Halovenus sp. WSH3]|uniref:BZIP transcription factor n=1 Tax=Halovenus carboxidivorans TaxID=2692199 RepID=A0A6B0T0Q9_9EURY|nr:bZIP transcription factor [Halovenus carboxidivorans]MXR51455.1 bZIP transcription factor [Halovenus carboxidivorans]